MSPLPFSNSWLISSRFLVPIQEAPALFISVTSATGSAMPDLLWPVSRLAVTAQRPAPVQAISNLTVTYVMITRGLMKAQIAGPRPRLPSCRSVGGAWVFAFLKGPQVMLRLLLQGPHFRTPVREQWSSFSQEIIWATSHRSEYKRSSFLGSRSQDYKASSELNFNKAD